MFNTIVFFIFMTISSIQCWEALPQIPTGRRSQYLVLHENGGYKYGYDTGEGSAAQQSGDASNQVKGSYLYDSPSGEKLSIKYTAGTQGFVPEGIPTGPPVNPAVLAVPILTQYASNPQDNEDETTSSTGDASYNFGFDTDTYRRQESSDARGNIKGSYSYNNEAGTHDLTYVAGENTGFVAVSGSLAAPNGLGGSVQGYSYNPSISGNVNSVTSLPSSGIINEDGSYSFGYSTADSSQQQSGDSNGNVKGSFSYRNSAGNHDLSYIAGSSTGFQVTGGSLSIPNGVGNGNPNLLPPTSANTLSPSQQNDLSSTGDSSYSFTIDTDNYKRSETSDATGNVKGSFSYKNSAGIHDLSFVAGSATGFQPTGGNLANLNNIPGSLSSLTSSSSVSDIDNEQSSVDASYNFSIDTDEYKRTETSDANGNIVGSYSYKNSAGQHDLSFEAGPEKGFKTTGGSLSVPAGLNESQLRSGGFNVQIPYASIPVNDYSAVVNSVLPASKHTYRIGNVEVHNYLPPSNEKKKFGYIFDTKY